MKLEEFSDFAERIIEEEVPAPLLKELHMGIIVLLEENRDKYDEDRYIMGEYISNEMGNHIVIYYGSFFALLAGESADVWQEELRETIKHEVWHHVEALSGVEKLAYQEMWEEESRKSSREKETTSSQSKRLRGLWKRLRNLWPFK